MTLKTALKSERHVYKGMYVTLDRLRRLYPKRYYLLNRWKQHHGARASLDNPSTFNEKLYWGLFYADNALARQCSDKLAVRDYVGRAIGKEYLNKLFGVYNGMTHIKFSELPSSFVLKNTHDSSSILLVTNKAQINYRRLIDLDIRLALNYGKSKRQWVYDRIKPRLIAEQYLGNASGEPPADYKVFCFNGVARFIQVDTGRFRAHEQSSYDREWRRLPFSWDHATPAQTNVQEPDALPRMIACSETLASPFNHVRVDWYICNRTLIFGEMTFFHLGGIGRLNQHEWDCQIGRWFQISSDLSY